MAPSGEPQRAAYEKFCELFPAHDLGPWETLSADNRQRWWRILKAGTDSMVAGVLNAAGVTIDEVTDAVTRAVSKDTDDPAG